MPTDLEQTIKDNAGGPRRAQGDAGSIEQHSLKDQIEADRYLAAQKAAKKKGFSVRVTRVIPPGASE